MKSRRMRLFPLLLMLVAGSFTSIMTYYFQYEIKAALLVLLSVLLIFYLLGLLVVNVIYAFDQKNQEERMVQEWEEGIVLEKDSAQEEVVAE